MQEKGRRQLPSTPERMHKARQQRLRTQPSPWGVNAPVSLYDGDDSWVSGRIGWVRTEWREEWAANGLSGFTDRDVKHVCYTIISEADACGDTYYLGWKCGEAVPVPDAVKGRFLRLRKEHNASGATKGIVRRGERLADESRGVKNFMRVREIKRLNGWNLLDAGLADVTMSFWTDEAASPAVTVKWDWDADGVHPWAIAMRGSAVMSALMGEADGEGGMTHTNVFCFQLETEFDRAHKNPHALVLQRAYTFLLTLPTVTNEEGDLGGDLEGLYDCVTTAREVAHHPTESHNAAWTHLYVEPGPRRGIRKARSLAPTGGIADKPRKRHHPWRLASRMAAMPGRRSDGTCYFDCILPEYKCAVARNSKEAPLYVRIATRSLKRGKNAINSGVDVSASSLSDARADARALMEKFLAGGWATGGHPALDQLLLDLTHKKHALDILDSAAIPVGEREPQHFLAYLAAMLCLASFADDDVHPMEDNGATPADPLINAEQLLDAHCPPMLRVFLQTFTTVRIRAAELRAQQHGIYRYDANTTNGSACNARIYSAFSSLIGANVGSGRSGNLATYTCMQEYITLILLLDNRGVSDAVINQLAKFNICEGADKGRVLIERAAQQLSIDGLFPPIDSEDGVTQLFPALAFSGDNADVHKYGNVTSFIALTCAFLGFYLTREEIHRVREGLTERGEMPPPSSTVSKATQLTSADKDVIALFDAQMMVMALIIAEGNLISEDSRDGAADASAAPLAGGEKVTFLWCGGITEATVVNVIPPQCTVRWSHGDGDATVHTADAKCFTRIPAGAAATGAVGAAAPLLASDAAGAAAPPPATDDTSSSVAASPCQGSAALHAMAATPIAESPREGAAMDVTPAESPPPSSEAAAAAAGAADAVAQEAKEAAAKEAAAKEAAARAAAMHEARRVAGWHRFTPSTSWVFDLLCDFSSKHARATVQVVQRIAIAAGNRHVLQIGVDFEFYVSLAYLFFLSKTPIIPTIAFGHLLKSVAVSMFSYYDVMITGPYLRAQGYVRDTPAYNKIVKGTHIKATVDHVACAALFARVAFAKLYLEDTANRSKWDAAKASLVADNTVRVVLLGVDFRPMVLLCTPAELKVAGEVQDWMYMRAGGRCAEAAKPRGPLWDPDVRDEFIYIRTLKMNNRGMQLGVRHLCSDNGIDLGPHPTKALAQARLFAFKFAGSGDAGRAAAALVAPDATRSLPVLPDGANVSLKAVVDFLFVAGLPLEMLMLDTRVRLAHSVEPRNDVRAAVRHSLELRGCGKCTAAGLATCRCSSRHRWLVACKAMLTSVFMRRQPNYQRALSLFLIFVHSILEHPDDVVVEVTMTYIYSALAMSRHGNSHACTPLDLHQEKDMMSTKQVAARSPTHGAATTSRVMVSTAMIHHREQGRHRAKVLQKKPLGPESAVSTKVLIAEAEKNKQAIHIMNVIVKLADEAADNTKVAGHTATAMADPQRVFFAASIAALAAHSATRAIAEGLVHNVAVPMPEMHVKSLSSMTVVTRAQTREQKAMHKKLVAAELNAKISDIRATGSILLESSVEMFARNVDKAGAGKAQLALEILKQYPSVVHLHTIRSDVLKDLRQSGALGAAGAGTMQIVRTVDFLQSVQRAPSPRAGSTGDNIKELARSMLELMVSPQFVDDSTVMLVVCIDCVEYITWLRDIQRRKRHKEQDDSELEAGMWEAALDTQEMKASGFRDLMGSKAGGLVRLLQQIEQEAKNANRADAWDFNAKLRRGFALVVVGGASKAFTVIRKASPRDAGIFLLPSTLATGGCFTSAEITLCFDALWKQGEGETMIFVAVRRVLSVLLAKYDSVNVAAYIVFNLLCNDVDALGGKAMAEVHRVKEMCAALGIAAPQLRLTVKPKSKALCDRIGLEYSKRASLPRGVVAQGDLLYASVDLEALYVAIGSDPNMEGFGATAAARAVGGTAGMLALTSNDMMGQMYDGAKGEMGVAAVFAAMRSKHYQALAKQFSPLVVEKHAADAEQITFELDFNGARLALYVALMRRSRSARQLDLRYERKTQTDAKHPLSYNTLRAISAVAGEAVATPTEIGVNCYAINAHAVFNQHVNWPTQLTPRPPTAALEVLGTSFITTAGDTVVPVYELQLRPGRKAGEAAVEKHLRKQFGPLMDVPGAPEFPFAEPSVHLLEAHGLGGVVLSRVPADLAIARAVVRSEKDIGAFAAYTGQFHEAQGDCVVFAAIVEKTLLQHCSRLMPKGCGRPQLSSATIATVCTNKGDPEWAVDAGDANPYTLAQGAEKFSIFVPIMKDRGHARHNEVKILMHGVIGIVVRRATAESAADEGSGDSESDGGNE